MHEEAAQFGGIVGMLLGRWCLCASALQHEIALDAYHAGGTGQLAIIERRAALHLAVPGYGPFVDFAQAEVAGGHVIIGSGGRGRRHTALVRRFDCSVLRMPRSCTLLTAVLCHDVIHHSDSVRVPTPRTA